MMKYFTAGLAIILFVPTLAHGAELLGPSCTRAVKKISKFHGVKQNDLTSWCWAATGQTMIHLYGKSKARDRKQEQCDMVDKVYPSVKPCCTNQPCWTKLGYPEFVLDDYEFDYLPQYEFEQLNWTDATEEICQGRSFISGIEFQAGDKHSVVIMAYDTRPQHGPATLWAYDPADDDIKYITADAYANVDPNAYFIHVRDTHHITPRNP